MPLRYAFPNPKDVLGLSFTEIQVLPQLHLVSDLGTTALPLVPELRYVAAKLDALGLRVEPSDAQREAGGIREYVWCDGDPHLLITIARTFSSVLQVDVNHRRHTPPFAVTVRDPAQLTTLEDEHGSKWWGVPMMSPPPPHRPWRIGVSLARLR